jgi:hypothetical protein
MQGGFEQNYTRDKRNTTNSKYYVHSTIQLLK